MNTEIIVLMLTKNSSKWLSEVLIPIKTKQNSYNINLVVVDGNSCDNTIETITEAFPNSAIMTSASRNLATCRNMALRMAHAKFPKADYMSWIDSDVVVPKDFFERCVKLLSDERIGIVGVRFELERDPPKHFVSKFYRDRTDITRKGVYSADYTTTACSMWKASLSKNIVLDERLKRAGEDVDFNLQITKQGYTALIDANEEPSWHIRPATVKEELHRVKDHGVARALNLFLHADIINRKRRFKTFLAALLILFGWLGLALSPWIGFVGFLPFTVFYFRHWLKCRDKRRLDYAFFGFLLSVIFFTRFLQGLIQYKVLRR